MKPRTSRSLVWFLAWAMMLSSIGTTASAVKKNQTLVELLYCTPSWGCSVAWFYYQEVEVVVNAGRLDVNANGTWGSLEGGEMQAIYEAPAPQPVDGGGGGGCGDERDVIIHEYHTYGVEWIPGCADLEAFGDHRFSQSGDTHPPWGIINGVLYNKVAEVQEYALYELRVTGGYRCPHKNHDLPDAAAQSRHMFGTAIDMTPPLDRYSPPTLEEYNHLRSAASQTGPRWMSEWSTYPSNRHLHADWVG